MRVGDIVAKLPQLAWFLVRVRRPMLGGTTRLAPGAALAPASAVEDHRVGGAARQAMVTAVMVMIMELELHRRQRVRRNRLMRHLSGEW